MDKNQDEVRGNGANTGVPIKDQIASGSLNPSTLPLIDEILLKASSTGGTFLDLGAMPIDAESAQDFDAFIKRNWVPVLNLTFGPDWRSAYDSELTAMLALQVSLRPASPAPTPKPKLDAFSAPITSNPLSVPDVPQANLPVQSRPRPSPPPTFNAAGDLTPPSPDNAGGAPPEYENTLATDDGSTFRAFTVEAVDVDGKRRRLRRKRAASPTEIDDIGGGSSTGGSLPTSPAGSTPQQQPRGITTPGASPSGVSAPGSASKSPSIMQRVIKQVSKLNISPPPAEGEQQQQTTLNNNGGVSSDSVPVQNKEQSKPPAQQQQSGNSAAHGGGQKTSGQSKPHSAAVGPEEMRTLQDDVANSLRLVQDLSQKMHAGLKLMDAADHVVPLSATSGETKKNKEVAGSSTHSHSREEDEAMERLKGVSGLLTVAGLRTLVSNSLADRTDVLGRSALHVAAAAGKTDVVRLLVRAGCDWNKRLTMDYRVLLSPATPAFNASRPAKRGRYSLGAHVPMPHVSNYQHCTPLHLAAANGHLDVVEELLACPSIDVNIRGADGATPLHFAAEGGHSGVVARLCRASGIDVDAADRQGRTALHLASAHGRQLVVVELWARGARIDPVDRFGWTPLHYAAREGYTEVAASLVIAGSAVQAADNNGIMAAHLAAQHGRVEILEKLLMAGFVSDAFIGAPGSTAGPTALHLAAAEGHDAVVNALLRAAAKPALLDQDGATAAVYAARGGHYGLVSVLTAAAGSPLPCARAGDISEEEANTIVAKQSAFIKFATEPNSSSSKPFAPATDVVLDLCFNGIEGSSVWTFAEAAAAGGLVNVLKTLPDLFTSPNAAQLALQAAAENNRPNVVSWLLENAPGEQAASLVKSSDALAAAAAAGYFNTCNVLISHGMDPCQPAEKPLFRGNTPLHEAFRSGFEETAVLLLHTADIQKKSREFDTLDFDGFTILHYAVKHRMDTAFRMLLDFKAPVNTCSKDSKRTALHFAAETGAWTYMLELLEAGADTAVVDAQNMTPLHEVATRGDLAPFALLYGETTAVITPPSAASLLSAAIRGGSPEMVGMLLYAGKTTPEACQNMNQYPVHLAAREGFVPVLQCLRDAGFDMAARDADGKTPLHHVPTGYGHLPPASAVLRHEDYVAAAEMLLLSGCAVDDVDSHGCTPLHIAAGCGSQDVLLAFLEVSGNCDVADSIGWTPLFWACAEGQVYAAEALLDLGANPLGEDCNHRTPLHFAAEGGHSGCVRLLVSRINHTGRRSHRHPSLAANRSNKTAAANGGSASRSKGVAAQTESHRSYDEGSSQDYSHDAEVLDTESDEYSGSEAGEEEASSTAIATVPPASGKNAAANANEDKAGIHKPDQNGQTPLQLASQAGAVECVAALLDSDGTAEAKRMTALHLAVKQQLIDVVERLLTLRRVHVGAKDVNGCTALHLAASVGNVEITHLLISAHSDVDDAAADGDTALHKAALGGHGDVVTLLLKARCQVDSRNSSGSTPLYNAASQGHCNIILDLLQAGAAVDAATTSGCTPLYIAANNGWAEAVGILLHEADPDAELNNGSTALHAAAQNGHVDVVQRLLQSPCDPDHEMQDGCTALHKACQAGHKEVVETLLSHGTDVDIPNNQGYTPLHMAASKGWVEIVEKLLEHGADIHSERKGGWTAIQSAASAGYFDVVLKLAQHGAPWRRKGDADVVKLLSRKTTLKVSYIEGRLRIAEKERQRRTSKATANGGHDDKSQTEPTDLKKAAEEADAAMAALLQEENAAKEKAERQKAKKAKKKQKKAAQKQAEVAAPSKEKDDEEDDRESDDDKGETSSVEEVPAVVVISKSAASKSNGPNNSNNKKGSSPDSTLSPPSIAVVKSTSPSTGRSTIAVGKGPAASRPPPPPPPTSPPRTIAIVPRKDSPYRQSQIAKPPPPPPPPPPSSSAAPSAKPAPPKAAAVAARPQPGSQPAMALPTVRNSPWGTAKPAAVGSSTSQQAGGGNASSTTSGFGNTPAIPVPQHKFQVQQYQQLQQQQARSPGGGQWQQQQQVPPPIGVAPPPPPPQQQPPQPPPSMHQSQFPALPQQHQQQTNRAVVRPPGFGGQQQPQAATSVLHPVAQQQQSMLGVQSPQHPSSVLHQQQHSPGNGVPPQAPPPQQQPGFMPLFGVTLPTITPSGFGGGAASVDWSMMPAGGLVQQQQQQVVLPPPQQQQQQMVHHHHHVVAPLFAGSLTSSIESEADELLNGIHGHVHRELSAQTLASPGLVAPGSHGGINGPPKTRPVGDADGIDDLLGLIYDGRE